MRVWIPFRLGAAIVLSLAGPDGRAAAETDAPPPAAYNLEVSLSARGEQLAAYAITVEPGKGYLLALPARDSDMLVIDVAADTRAAAYSAFERDLGPRAGAQFVHVSVSLERARRDASGRVFVDAPVGSGLLLPLTGRAVQADIPAAGDDALAPRLAPQLSIRARAEARHDAP